MSTSAPGVEPRLTSDPDEVVQSFTQFGYQAALEDARRALVGAAGKAAAMRQMGEVEELLGMAAHIEEMGGNGDGKEA